MRWIALLAALTCVVTLLGCSGVSKPTPGIFGKVISKGTRQPIANATVKVLSGDVEVASVTTNGEVCSPFQICRPAHTLWSFPPKVIGRAVSG
jgi:hypothetical protein